MALTCATTGRENVQIYIIRNTSTGFMWAFDTEDNAKDAIRGVDPMTGNRLTNPDGTFSVYDGMYTIQKIEVLYGRPGATALFNHIAFTDDQVKKTNIYTSSGGRLREQK